MNKLNYWIEHRKLFLPVVVSNMCLNKNKHFFGQIALKENDYVNKCHFVSKQRVLPVNGVKAKLVNLV